MEQIAKETYEGKLKRGELSTEHILKTYAELEDAAKQGYGKNWLKINGDTGMPNQESVQLQKNLWKFSGAKNFAMLEQINQLMTKNGKAISWEDFKREVMKLNAAYNKNYLQAEWQTAKQAAKMAANWESYTANAERYPNLEYRTQNDGRVRDSHYSMHGVVAPIHSDFWKSNYPPNGWRCRCFVVQTAAEPTKKEKIPVLTEKEHPLEFRGNVGISGEIFKETDANKGKPHPYFALATSGEYKKAFEYSKLATPLNKVYEAENGATVKVSPFAHESDLKDNLKSAIITANELNENINIRAHLEIDGCKNPEYEMLKMIGDGTHREGNVKNFVGNSFTNKLGENGQLQALDKTFIILNFGEINNLSNKEFKSIAGSTHNQLKKYQTVQFLIFIYNNKAIKVERSLITEDFTESLKNISETLRPMKTTEGNR